MFTENFAKKLIAPSDRREIWDIFRVGLILFLVSAYCGLYLFKTVLTHLSARV